MKTTKQLRKVGIMTASSTESFYGKRSGAAFESLGSEQENPVALKAAQDLTSFIVDGAYDILVDSQILFTSEPAAAYDELITLLQRPDVKEAVVGKLRARNSAEEATLQFADEMGLPRDVASASLQLSRLREKVEDIFAEGTMLKAAVDTKAKEYAEEFPRYADRFDDIGE